jgi:hypothetical protein
MNSAAISIEISVLFCLLKSLRIHQKTMNPNTLTLLILLGSNISWAYLYLSLWRQISATEKRGKEWYAETMERIERLDEKEFAGETINWAGTEIILPSPDIQDGRNSRQNH